MTERPERGQRWPKLTFVIACIGALALIAAGCGGDDDDEGDGAAANGEVENVTVTLPSEDGLAWSGYEIARGSDGPFEAVLGIEPETQVTGGGGFTAQQFATGNIDFAVIGMTSMIIGNAKGDDLVAIAQVLSDVVGIRAVADSGVTSLEELDGKTVGISDLGGGEVPILRAALASVGLEAQTDVELLPLGEAGPAVFVKALEDDKVQAVAGFISDLTPLEFQGIEFVDVMPDEYQNLPDDVVAVKRELLDPENEDRLQQVLDFVKGWNIGTRYGDEYPEDGLRRVCLFAQEQCQDMEFAAFFYERAIAVALDEALSGGCIEEEAVRTVRDTLAVADAPRATDLPVEELFTTDYCEELVATDEEVQAFAERTGVAEGG